MRLLNKGFLGLLAAIAFFCSGCHSMGWHAMCYHGSTQGYFPPPAATSSSSSSSSSSSGGHWWSRSSRARKAHSDNGNHYGQEKNQGDKPQP